MSGRSYVPQPTGDAVSSSRQMVDPYTRGYNDGFDAAQAHSSEVTAPHPLPWRQGRKVGRTLYDANDVLIGVMDTPELAARVVAAMGVTR